MRSKRRSRESMVTHPILPSDTIKDILARLPVKSITRFESVCKPWYSLIKSPDFISAHFRRTCRNPYLLIRRYHNPTGNNFAISFIDTRTSISQDVRIPFLASLVRFPKIIASCNGLLCLDISPCYASAFVLWNVSMKQFRSLPKPRITDAVKPIWMVAVGFGYNLQVNDFKLVRIVNFDHELEELPITVVEVYSWSSGSWRVLDHGMVDDAIRSCVIGGAQQSVAVNGVLYWTATGVGKLVNHKFVVSFDMGIEEFRKIKLPDIPNGVCVKLLSFKGSLVAALYPTLPIYSGYGRSVDRFELWVLDDYGANGKCWCKMQSIQPFSSGLGCPMGVFNDSELIMKRVEGNCISLSLVDPRNQFITRLPICSADFSCDVYSYVDSLVPVDPGEDEVVDQAP